MATKIGFFSVVKKGGEGLWMIRAREKRDLQNLLLLAKMDARRLIESEHTDYAFRLVVNKAELSNIMQLLEDGIDYSNFKSEVARHSDQNRKPYHQVWATMAAIQPRKSFSLSGGKRSSGTAGKWWDEVERQMDDRPERDYSKAYHSERPQTSKELSKELDQLEKETMRLHDDLEEIHPPRHAYSDKPKREVVISELNKKVSRKRMKALWSDFRASGKKGLMDFREWLKSQSAGSHPAKAKGIKRESEGHVGWYVKHGLSTELYKDSRGDLMSAPATRPIEHDGYRRGDWEAPRHLADDFALAILGPQRAVA